MLQSMTGFGLAVSETNEKKVTVEIKSLNHKFIETNIKIPSAFSDKELEVKNICLKNLERGKIYVTVNIEDLQADTSCIDTGMISSYYKVLSKLSAELQVKADSLFESILHLPEVIKSTKTHFEKKESDWELLKKTLQEAIYEVRKYREKEGLSLHKDIERRINKIQDIIRQIGELESKQRQNIVDRINKKIEDLNMDFDQSRMEQEILFYIERCSIAEEIVRLQHHCDFFNQNLQLNESKGKKLNFIIQEILRELNTINAKSIESEIQKLSIDAKEEVDNIKEQLFNIL